MNVEVGAGYVAKKICREGMSLNKYSLQICSIYCLRTSQSYFFRTITSDYKEVTVGFILSLCL